MAYGSKPYGGQTYGGSENQVPLPGSVDLIILSIDSDESFGTPTLTDFTWLRTPITVVGEVGTYVYPAGFGGEQFGSPIIVAVGTAILPEPVPTSDDYGEPTIYNKGALTTPGTLTGEVASFIYPASLGAGGIFGVPSLTAVGTAIIPDPIPAPDAHGSPTLYDQAALAQPATLIGETTSTVVPDGIIPWSFGPANVFGVPRILDANAIYLDAGVPSAEAFGHPALITLINTVPAFPGGQPKVRYVPVTVGDVNDLCGCVLPDGRGLLVWRDGAAAEVRCAVLDQPEAWLQDGVISSLGQVTTLASHTSILSVTCFTDGTQVYVSYIGYDSPNVFHQDVKRFADPLNPVSLVSHGSFIGGAATTPYPAGFGIWNSEMGVQGIPLIDGNRWVYPAIRLYWWENVDVAQVYGRPAAWLSTNGGVSFTATQTVNYEIPFLPPTEMDWMSPHIHVDPATGYLYWASSGGWGSITNHTFESRDAGASWSLLTTSIGKIAPFTDYGGKLYVVGASDLKVYEATRTSGSLALSEYGVTYIGPNHNPQARFVVVRPVPDSTRVFVFLHDSVQSYLPTIAIDQISVG